MNKNFKVFQIHGLSGLLLVGFFCTCLFFGFIIFPVWLVMAGWNEIIAHNLQAPSINYFQAALLWSIVIISMYLIFRSSISIKIHTTNHELSNDELNDLMQEENPSKK